MLDNTSKLKGQHRGWLLGTSDVSKVNSISCFLHSDINYMISVQQRPLETPVYFPTKQLPVWFLLSSPRKLSLVRYPGILVVRKKRMFIFHFHGYISVKQQGGKYFCGYVSIKQCWREISYGSFPPVWWKPSLLII